MDSLNAIDLTILLQIAFVIFGLSIGLYFPDIDQSKTIWFTKHRSVFTHGPLPTVGLVVTILFGHAFLGYVLAESLVATLLYYNTIFYFTIGFCAGEAIHLAFDMSPKAWVAPATIHTPIGRLWPSISWLWMALGLVFSLYATLWLLPDNRQRVVLGAVMALIFLKYRVKEKKEGNHVMMPFITLCLAAWLSWTLVSQGG